MCHCFRRAFPASPLLLLSMWSLQSFAEDNSQCVSVHFAKGATSTVVHGNLSPDKVDCFTFGAGRNQYAGISLIAKDLSFSVENVGVGDRL
jgi:hypothetical protein